MIFITDSQGNTVLPDSHQHKTSINDRTAVQSVLSREATLSVIDSESGDSEFIEKMQTYLSVLPSKDQS